MFTLAVEVLQLKGKFVDNLKCHCAQPEPNDEIFLTAAIEGKPRTTKPGIVSCSRHSDGDGLKSGKCEGQVRITWEREGFQEAGKLSWLVDEASIPRLKAHNPRFRLTVIKKEKQDGKVMETPVGFIQLDLRDPELYTPRHAKSSRLIKAFPIYGQNSSQMLSGSPVYDGESEIEVELIAKIGPAEEVTEDALSGRSPIVTKTEYFPEEIGAAYSEDRIVIGTSNEAVGYTLSITVHSASFLQSVIPKKGKFDKDTHYTLEYNMFGVPVFTENFQNLKYPTFPAIRDSFKLRCRIEDLEKFFKLAPVNICLCSYSRKKQNRYKSSSKGEKRTLAITKLSFESLFEKMNNSEPFAECIANCAFPFVTTQSFDIKAQSPLPSVAVEIALIVDTPSLYEGQRTFIEGESEDHGYAEQEGEPKNDISTISMSVPSPPKHNNTNFTNVSLDGQNDDKDDLKDMDRFKVYIVNFELDPLNEDMYEEIEDDATRQQATNEGIDARCNGVKLCIKRVERGSKQVEMMESQEIFRCGEYLEVDPTNVSNVGVKVDSEMLNHYHIVIECVSADGEKGENGYVIGKGTLSLDSFSLDEKPECWNENVILTDGRLSDFAVGRVTLKLERPTTVSNPVVDKEDKQEKEHVNPEETLNSTLLEDESGPVGRFRMLVDVRSVKGLSGTYNIYATYTYPLFGHTNEITTKPAVMVNKTVERTLPNGLRDFNFKASAIRLEKAIEMEPLIIELWDRNRYGDETRLGFGSISLSKLFAAKAQYRFNGKNFNTLAALNLYKSKLNSTGNKLIPYIKVRFVDTYITVYAFGENNDTEEKKRIGLIRVSLKLEDFGLDKNANSADLRNTTPDRQSEGKSNVSNSDIKNDDLNLSFKNDENVNTLNEVGMSVKVEALDTPKSSVYEGHIDGGNYDDVQNETAWIKTKTKALAEKESALNETIEEFERWRETEVRKMEVQLKSLEKSRMVQLEQEWATREHERVKTLKTAQAEYEQLDERLRRALVDAEHRERAVTRLEQDLKRAAALKMQDIEVLHRRNREECDHKVQLHKERAAALEKRLKRANDAAAQAEKRTIKVEEDFAKFREQVRNSNEVELQRRIAQLEGEKADLLSRLEAEKTYKVEAESQKAKMKSQLVTLAKQLQNMRRMEGMQAERDLEKLRIEYIAREERYALDGERSELKDIREELKNLRAGIHVGVAPVSVNRRYDSVTSASPRPRNVVESPVNSRKLEKERKELLETGVYSDDHPIIIQLDKQIELARNC